MWTVKEVSKLTGVSVRTLQYYDKIGLLPAAAYTKAGYRQYDQETLAQLQQILLFRELEFPLKDIKTILHSPKYSREQALEQQQTLLQLKKERLERLIALAQELKGSKGAVMKFSAFDDNKIEAYAAQAKQAWGDTQAYQEYAQKSSGRTAEAEQATGAGLMALLAEFGRLQHTELTDPTVIRQVRRLQEYITEHYYTCSDVILSQLGQMYAAGGEFTANIDAAGGTGTAEFANKAIQAYCKGRQ